MNQKHLRIHLMIVGGLVGVLLLCWGGKVFDFFRPAWLLALLALPLFTWLAVKGVAGLPSRTNAVSATMRCLLYIIIVVALADIQYVLRSDKLAVYFLMDYSASIPEVIREKQLKYVNAAVETKREKDLAGIIVFGEEPSIEYIPNRELQIDSLHSVVNPGYTNLQAATDLAVAAFPPNAKRKIVLITDGNQNAGSIVEATRYAASEGVRLAVLPVSYRIGKEVLVEKVQLPEKVKENEPFELRVHVNSLQETDASLTIFRNGQPIGKPHAVKLKAGENRYFVEMQIKEPGFFVYTARISAPGDTIQDNNEASNFVYIKGDSRILFVSPGAVTDEVEHLIAVCKQENFETELIAPEDFPSEITKLQLYDCIVLANVPAGELSEDQMVIIKTCVKDLGTGLIMVGGKDSFGAGGYEDTPVEEALPVSMDIKQKKIVPKGALVLILHTCEFARGNYWAKQVTKAAIKTVHPRDQVGVVYYGGGDTWLFPLREASNKPYMYNKVDKCEPGDMPSFAPAFALAVKGLLASDAMVRHIIVISDGDPSRPNPKDIAKMASAGITVSTVGINPHSARDVDVLKYIAMKTGGRYYFVKDPRKLPQIFVKEAKVVKRSLIFNDPFQPLLSMASELTKGVQQSQVPQLLAYVATTPKERALVSITSDNDNKDPVLAEWRYGLGKSVAFTSDASTNWGKHWVPWVSFRRIWGQIFRWTARKREKSNLTMHTRRDGDKVLLTIDAIDEEGQFINFSKLEARRVDSANEGHRIDVQQIAAGRYQAEFTAKDFGVNLLNIAYTDPRTGRSGFVRSGVSLPYSAEFKELNANISLLQRVARIGEPKGVLLHADPQLADIFVSDQEASISQQPIWEYLLVLALLLFMIDVVIRRVIITGEDVSSVLAEAKHRVGIGKRPASVEHDETMSALLKRKDSVFNKKDEPAETAPQARPEADFKERLEQQVKQGGGNEGRAIAEATEEAETPGTRRRQRDSSADDVADTASSPTDEQSYTSRLLDAKRRARQEKQDDDE